MKAKYTKATLKINRKIKVFSIFLLLSALFWFFSALSGKYAYLTEFSIAYKNIPSHLIFQETPSTKIEAQIYATGFKILGHKLKTKTINLDVSTFSLKENNTYYYLPNNQLPLLQKQLSKTEITHFNTDSLLIYLGKLITKRIPIRSTIKLGFKPGYKLTENLNIKPDSIVIKGPQKIIDSIKYIYTIDKEINLIDENFSKTIDLKLPSINKAVSFETKQVTLIGKVAKFTQGQIEIPIKIIGLPEDIQMKLYPKMAKVVYQVTFENYQKITEKSFIISCNYPVNTEEEKTVLPLMVTHKPNFITDYSIQPKEVTYLLKK